MHSRRGVAATIVAVIGLALVIFEAVRITLQTDTLGTMGAVLLYAGLGLFVIGAAVVIADQTAKEPDIAPIAVPSDGS